VIKGEGSGGRKDRGGGFRGATLANMPSPDKELGRKVEGKRISGEICKRTKDRKYSLRGLSSVIFTLGKAQKIAGSQ